MMAGGSLGLEMISPLDGYQQKPLAGDAGDRGYLQVVCLMVQRTKERSGELGQ